MSQLELQIAVSVFVKTHGPIIEAYGISFDISDIPCRFEDPTAIKHTNILRRPPARIESVDFGRRRGAFQPGKPKLK